MSSVWQCHQHWWKVKRQERKSCRVWILKLKHGRRIQLFAHNVTFINWMNNPTSNIVRTCFFLNYNCLARVKYGIPSIGVIVGLSSESSASPHCVKQSTHTCLTHIHLAWLRWAISELIQTPRKVCGPRFERLTSKMGPRSFLDVCSGAFSKISPPMTPRLGT